MGKRKYTDEQRAEALELYKEHGPGEAARRLHIPMPTIASWARRSGTQTDAPAAVKAAVEMAKLSREQKRELLREKLLDQALTLVEDMDGTVLLVTRKGEQLKLPASPSDKKDLAKAMRDVVETFRLEVGEATDRTESVGPDEFKGWLQTGWEAYQLGRADQAQQQQSPTEKAET